MRKDKNMERPIGKYVAYREEYLKENAPEVYAKLVEQGELNAHLDEINRKANEMKERVIEKLKAFFEKYFGVL